MPAFCFKRFCAAGDRRRFDRIGFIKNNFCRSLKIPFDLWYNQMEFFFIRDKCDEVMGYEGKKACSEGGNLHSDI